MSHLVKPVSFRVGKTQPWANNVLLSNQALVSSSLLLCKGIEKLNKALLRRKRLYVVKGNIMTNSFSKITYNLIYVPKIKTKPREYFTGTFLRRSIYKPFNWALESNSIKDYVNRRKEKIAKIRKRYRPKKLNRWLSRRMFRGASTVIWKRKKKCVKILSSRDVQLFRCIPTGLIGDRLNADVLSFSSTWPRKVITRRLQNIHRAYRSKLSWRERWLFDRIKSRRFNSRRLSLIISRMLHRKIRMQVLNLFSYLASKQVITFKSHQNHFWNFAYRRYRFQYKNYFDIANAFLAIGLLDHAEGFLLSILRAVLPLILKIKRFFKFLNTVIKKMPELEDKFSVFKIHIGGKLAGGTKRTKSHSIGYGTLAVQTLDVAVFNNFLHYRHIYGEFGLKLVMCKYPTYKSPLMLA